MSKEKVAIVGAGLCGSLLAVYFAKRGFDVDVFEYRKDLRDLEGSGGRSINMALSHRGIEALKEVGLYGNVQPHMIPMKGRFVHLEGGDTSFQPYGTQDHHVIYSISRKTLNEVLLSCAEEYESIDLYFEKKCIDYDVNTQMLTFEDQRTDQMTQVKYDYVFGTDGAFSKVRQAMMKTDRFNYSQDYIPQGYKELCIPAGQGESFLIEKEALHIWPRKKFMLIALPNTDGSFTVTLFLDFDGEPGFDDLSTKEEVTKFFKKEFPDAYELMGNTEEQFFENPTSSLATIRCFPWNVEDHTLILGDAAHAVVPFFGQGMNASFEDVQLFFRKFDKVGINQAIQGFSAQRKKDADAIADMALENFVEMRDSVSDPEYLKRRKIAQQLEKENPENFQSRYTMVSFTSIPYADVYQKGIENRRFIDEKLSKK